MGAIQTLMNRTLVNSSRDKTAIVALHMTESKQDESCSSANVGSASVNSDGRRANEVQADRIPELIIMCAEGRLVTPPSHITADR